MGRATREKVTGIYNRGKPGHKVLWMSYTITEELRIKHGLRRRLVREPCGVGDLRNAKAARAQRRREVEDGTWLPRSQGGSGLTVRAHSERWIAGRKAAGVRGVDTEEQRFRDYVWPAIGDRVLGEIRRADMKALVQRLQAVVSETTGRPLAPRVVRNIYSLVHNMYEDALADEIVPFNPCTLKQKRGELPKPKDANPHWRADAVFTRHEVEILISDERIPEHRRVLYALLFLAGLRIGEAVGRRWRDYDPVTEPLGRLTVATQYDGQPLKTDEPRLVPVHPVLAKILARWKLGAYEIYSGYRPAPDALIYPRGIRRRKKAEGAHDRKNMWVRLQGDLRTLGLRQRRLHDTRRTLISLALGDGADKYLLKWVTHGRPKADAFDAYVQPTWESLCRQISCLRIALLASPGNVVQLVPAATHGGTRDGSRA